MLPLGLTLVPFVASERRIPGISFSFVEGFQTLWEFAYVAHNYFNPVSFTLTFVALYYYYLFYIYSVLYS
jgi:hypothetical protein